MTNSNVLATGKTRIKDHKKGGRFWIEGIAKLGKAMAAGERYSYTVTDGCLVITANANGSHKVSGKAERPIIDICNTELGKAFGLGTQVVVTYCEGLITVKRVG